MPQRAIDRSLRGPAPGEPGGLGTEGPRLQEVDGREFRELVSSGRPLIVLFGSPRCEPCHALAATLAQAAAKHPGKVHVVQVDVDKQTDLGGRYKIWALPTVIQFCQGEQRRLSARTAASLDEAMQRLQAQATAEKPQSGQTPSIHADRDGQGLLPVSALHASLTPFGRDIERIGIPACLSQHRFSLEGLIARIGKNDASGLRVGCGQILTNRHVFEQLGGDAEGPAFVGRVAFPGRRDLFGRAAPPPLPGGSLVMPWYVGRYGDWALLDEADPGICAMPPLRSAKSLRQDELLWLIGGSDGESDFVTVGRLQFVKGVNGILHDCDVRPGMSGSAIIDNAGQVVGIFSTQFGWPGRRAMFVTIDAIAEGIEALRPLDATLPVELAAIVR